MSTTEVEAQKARPTEQGPVSRRWTREEYYLMGEQGLFLNQRVQLIEGEIVVMGPMGTRHATAVRLAFRLMTQKVTPPFDVISQLPFTFAGESEPEPDVAIVEGGPLAHLTQHPSSAVLVIEVSDTRLKYDQTVKRKLYASNGIPEYWVVNLKDGQVEVHLDPASGDYKTVSVRKPGEEIPISGLPLISVKVADLLP